MVSSSLVGRCCLDAMPGIMTNPFVIVNEKLRHSAMRCKQTLYFINMDVLAHGLWGGVAFGRKTRWQWRGAVWLGMAPDLLAFGPFFLSQLGSTDWSAFPPYVHQEIGRASCRE